MNKFINTILFVTLSVLFTACGSETGTDLSTSTSISVDEPKVYTQDINLPASGFKQYFSMVKAWKANDIKSISNSASWLQLNITDDSKLEVWASENISTESRNAIVIITLKNGDTLQLRVTQDGAQPPSSDEDSDTGEAGGIDSLNNVVSDRTAYIQRK